MHLDFADPRRLLIPFISASFWMALFLLPDQLRAANIQAVQGTKVLINLDGDSATEGDLFVATSPEGKKLGILRITKVRGAKAIAQIAKGRAEKGWQAVPRGAKNASHHEAKPEKTTTSGNSALKIGGLANVAMDNQSVQIQNDTVTMSGIGYGAVAFGDYYFTHTLSVRAITGLEMFNAAGTLTKANCTGSTSCNTNITYLNLGGYARWTFVPGNLGMWVGGGSYMLYPVGSSSNAITTDSIVLTYTLNFGLGADIKINDNMFIPVFFEYGIFPASGDVNTNFMGIRAGIGYSM